MLASQTLAVLSTRGVDFPHASLVSFAAGADLRTLVFATLRTTRKYANIARNPRVALTVDDRCATGADPRQTIVVTATGVAQEVPAQKREFWQNVYLARHPSLREFVASPDCALIAVAVKSYDIITDLQTVSVLSF
jgi:nitroimidazol reductase NimA-like FMN-containing flavoprotein (pyridoxamine 5'-phosphate oxidase superfamily)